MKKTSKFRAAPRLTAALLALCLVLPQLVWARGEDPERYIVTAASASALPELRRAIEETGGEIIYSYERAITGFCVLTADAETLRSLEGAERVITPQSYRTLAVEGSVLDETALARDEGAAAGAIAAIEGYNGAGTVIAVLDDGFETRGGWLVTGDASACAITKQDIARSLGALCASEIGDGRLRTDAVWLRWKAPFAYDYAEGDADVSPDGSSSHGTEVAALAAANSLGGEGCADGAAPGAQLLLMKVASGGSVSECELVAAIEDALILGADVINLSLGEAEAGGGDGTPGTALAAALGNAETEGVSVICAAGNSGSAGGGRWEELYGIDQAPVAQADSGTLSPLASLSAVTSAGSVDYYYRAVLCMESASGTLFTYTDSSAVYSATKQSFTAALDGRRLEYVPVPGVGARENYAELDVSGKLALVKRGELSFLEKLKIAAEMGAVGAIIYNNEPEAELVTMQIAGAEIPAVFVTLEVGETLAGESVRELIIAEGRTMQISAEGGGSVSAFSSRGVTASLGLAPDLCAFGGNLRAPSAQNSYDTVNGTSYSAALLSGYTAVLLQYRRDNGLDTAPAALRRALMNSAAPVTRSDTIVSPRAQGAGLCDIAGAAGLTLEVSGADGRGSLSLGELGDAVTFELVVRNLTSSERSFSLSAAVVTDGAASRAYDDESGILLPSEDSTGEFPYFVSGESVRLESCVVTATGAEGNLNAYAQESVKPSFTVAAGGELVLTLTLECAGLPLDIFTEGCYVEGMISLEPDSGSAVSLPFCGFYGDWSALAVMDASISGGVDTLYGGAYLYTYSTGNYSSGEKMLGTNDFDERPADFSLAAISPNRDGNCEYVGLRLTLLRDAETLRYEICDGDGAIIYKSGEYRGLRRSSLAGNVDVPVWDGTDPENSAYIYPDGSYTLRVYVTPVGGGEQRQEFSFLLDTVPPEAENIVLADGDLSFAASDDNGVQSVAVYTMAEDGLWRDFAEYAVPDSGEVRMSELSFDVSEASGGYIYIEISDYAGNVTAHRIKNEK